MIGNCFNACERGNIYFTNEFNHMAYLRTDTENEWLAISIFPENYPTLRVNTLTISDEGLAKHIQENYQGWTIHKLNLDGVCVDDEGYISGE